MFLFQAASVLDRLGTLENLIYENIGNSAYIQFFNFNQYEDRK